MQNKELQGLLINRLTGKVSSKPTIIDFGIGVGLAKKDFETIVPVAGCMALTTFFYWMINYTSEQELVAAIMASVAVYTDICLQIVKPLMENYNLSEKTVSHFTLHEGIEEKIKPFSEFIQSTYKTQEDKKRIDKAISLSHEHEHLFYDTVLNLPI